MNKLYEAYIQLHELKDLIDSIAITAKLIGYSVKEESSPSRTTITSDDQLTIVTLSPHELFYTPKNFKSRKQYIYTPENLHQDKLQKLNEFLQTL